MVKQELGFMKRKYRTGILAGMQCIVVDVGLIILASLCVSLILPGGTRGKTFSDPAFFLCALLFFLFSLYLLYYQHQKIGCLLDARKIGPT